MRADVSVDTRELLNLVNRFPNASAQALAVFTERVGRKVEREAKYAMRADVAGPDKARSRTGGGGGLVANIRFVQKGQNQIAGVVKSFNYYSKYIHGPPYYHRIKKKNGGFRKINPFFTTALEKSDLYIEAQKQQIITNISRNI